MPENAGKKINAAIRGGNYVGIYEILLIGIGLSMDAVAVSMTNGMVYNNVGKAKIAAMPLFFGIFQAIMPLLGYFAGGLFSDFICRYSGIVILLILGFIGAKMVKDGFSHKDDEHEISKSLTYKILFAQAVATSIDAFAVGVGFAAGGAEIVSSVLLIGLTTFILSGGAIFIGKRFGDILGSKAEVLGGVILICIGIKAIVESFMG